MGISVGSSVGELLVGSSVGLCEGLDVVVGNAVGSHSVGNSVGALIDAMTTLSPTVGKCVGGRSVGNKVGPSTTSTSSSIINEGAAVTVSTEVLGLLEDSVDIVGAVVGWYRVGVGFNVSDSNSDGVGFMVSEDELEGAMVDAIEGVGSKETLGAPVVGQWVASGERVGRVGAIDDGAELESLSDEVGAIESTDDEVGELESESTGDEVGELESESTDDGVGELESESTGDEVGELESESTGDEVGELESESTDDEVGELESESTGDEVGASVSSSTPTVGDRVCVGVWVGAGIVGYIVGADAKYPSPLPLSRACSLDEEVDVVVVVDEESSV